MRIRRSLTGWASVLAVCFLAATLTACGGTTTVEPRGDSGAAKASPSPSRSHTKKPPGMPPATPPEDANWKPLITIASAKGAPSSRTLVVGYTLPTPCSPGLQQAEVHQRADAVTVKLHRERPKPADEQKMCAQVIQHKTVKMTLDQPLGKRPLVDGSSGKTIKVAS